MRFVVQVSVLGKWLLPAAVLLLPASLLLRAQDSTPSTNFNWKDQGVIYLDHSLNARLHTVPIQAVHLGDGFWSARRRVTTEHSLLTFLAQGSAVENEGAVGAAYSPEGRGRGVGSARRETKATKQTRSDYGDAN